MEHCSTIFWYIAQIVEKCRAKLIDRMTNLMYNKFSESEKGAKNHQKPEECESSGFCFVFTISLKQELQ